MKLMNTTALAPVDIFPNRFCVQLSLRGVSELGEPPSTLPTVSNNKRQV